MADISKLDHTIMAREIEEALRARGVDLDFGLEGWRDLLEGIAQGVINHLVKHRQAFVIDTDTATSGNHAHGGYVHIQK